MFKLGDKVKVIKSENHSVNKVNDIGIITQIEEGDRLDIRVQVEGRENEGNWHSSKSELILLVDESIEKYKSNAEEDYMTVPISVLRYISELESRLGIIDSEDEDN